MGDIIRESLKNTVENTESIMESTNTEHNSESSNLWKILGLAGGTALLGGGSYAVYRWWKLKKQQEELQKLLPMQPLTKCRQLGN